MANLEINNSVKKNYYDSSYKLLIQAGESKSVAIHNVVTEYLDGKPRNHGKKIISKTERDAAFWTSEFVNALPLEMWRIDALTLALANYLGQEKVENRALLGFIASSSPDVVHRAVRYADLVMFPNSLKRAELEHIAEFIPEIAELCTILKMFDHGYAERNADLEKCKSVLLTLSVFELLVYASLYAFEHLIPKQFDLPSSPDNVDNKVQEAWGAINDLALWILCQSKTPIDLNEAEIARSLNFHLGPILFPSPSGQVVRHDILEAFKSLVLAQIELNSYISQSADAFSYDDGIQFVRRGNRLEIETIDSTIASTWRRNGKKLALLHGYWFNRALDDFFSSEMATLQIGSLENHEANCLAYIFAMRTQLRLSEVYGIDQHVIAETGESVNLFQALLSLELMSALFQRNFLQVFAKNLEVSNHWIGALRLLAFNGLKDGGQNRFPLTWSNREAKIANIIGWTVSADYPKGNYRSASAILDFWTSDWVALSVSLQHEDIGLRPKLFERPILKIGQKLIQLPWVVGLQNNSVAAINNLRRLGARRKEAIAETRRIEHHLGSLFETRGFRVVLNWRPLAEKYKNAGEIDIICAQDGIVIVIEVKSTYVRSSQRDAWLHATNTLRKAGNQLNKKTAAVNQELVDEGELFSLLGVTGSGSSLLVNGWIIDTSIEHDHERFNGFLKVSLEEVLIALRDDRHLLNDPDGVLTGQFNETMSGTTSNLQTKKSLYPNGFTASRFIEVVESESVWDEHA